MLDRERLTSLFEELELRRYDSCSCPVSFFANGDEGAEKVDLVVRKEGRLDCGISEPRCTGLSSTFAVYLSATFEGPVRKEGRLDCGISVSKCTGLSSTFAIYLSVTFEGPVKESREISTELRLLVSILLDVFTMGGEGNLGFAVKEEGR